MKIVVARFAIACSPIFFFFVVFSTIAILLEADAYSDEWIDIFY